MLLELCQRFIEITFITVILIFVSRNGAQLIIEWMSNGWVYAGNEVKYGEYSLLW